MPAGKSRCLVFVLPFTDMVSNYVRAQCLEGYQSDDWHFVFLKRRYPKFLNFFILRVLYRYWYYLRSLLKIKNQSKVLVAYFIKPQAPLLLFIVRRLLRIKVMVDVNDPYHLPELMGASVTKALFNNADWLIFESREYSDYWASIYGEISTIVSDTPQHECVYVNSATRDKSVIWIGSPHTSSYLIDYVEHFKLFNSYGFKVKLLGANLNTVNILRNASIKCSVIHNYDKDSLATELQSALISFIPMPNEELFLLRGNLKAKISMGYGCLVVASRIGMHERLIEHGVNGFLFNSLNDLKTTLEQIKNNEYMSIIALTGNKFVANKYSRNEHAKQLIEISKSIINKEYQQ
jgi:glycosyltransferase involved in cell wall biosynthesis